jgi:hypothetical protein
VEDAITKRHNNISIQAALISVLGICSLADGLGVIAPIACVVRSNPRSSLALVLDTIPTLKELESAPACREGVILGFAKCPTE